MNQLILLADGTPPEPGDYAEVGRFIRVFPQPESTLQRAVPPVEVVIVRPYVPYREQVHVAVEGDPEKITQQVATAAKKTTKEARR